MDSGLLTARGLAREFRKMGCASVHRSTVRQWLRETPPCPMAMRGVAGKPNLYRLADVLAWHTDYCEAHGLIQNEGLIK